MQNVYFEDQPTDSARHALLGIAEQLKSKGSVTLGRFNLVHVALDDQKAYLDVTLRPNIQEAKLTARHRDAIEKLSFAHNEYQAFSAHPDSMRFVTMGYQFLKMY